MPAPERLAEFNRVLADATDSLGIANANTQARLKAVFDETGNAAGQHWCGRRRRWR